MNTLKDFWNFLKSNSTGCIECFDAQDQKTTFSLEMWNKAQGFCRLDAMINGEMFTVLECTPIKLQEILDKYKSWWVRPLEVAADNWNKGKKVWVETDEELYDEMLCVLPPDFHARGAFAVGEPKTHIGSTPIYYCFKEDKQGFYWVQVMSIDELKKDLGIV
jgi:hypothetical protein